MTLTSRTDQPFWSDPDFTESGVRIMHPYPTDYEPEPVPYWPLDWVFATVDAMRKRDAVIAERDAVLAGLPRFTEECAEAEAARAIEEEEEREYAAANGQFGVGA